ncbi:MAG: hypothetical protein M1830_009733 [Pleopsidium flavum]|nr:MAG: hypothetical protein M1830_009733 [Pleopsidium flavum]
MQAIHVSRTQTHQLLRKPTGAPTKQGIGYKTGKNPRSLLLLLLLSHLPHHPRVPAPSPRDDEASSAIRAALVRETPRPGPTLLVTKRGDRVPRTNAADDDDDDGGGCPARDARSRLIQSAPWLYGRTDGRTDGGV